MRRQVESGDAHFEPSPQHPRRGLYLFEPRSVPQIKQPVHLRPQTTLFDIGAIRHELAALLGVPVDVLTPNALPDRFRALVIAQARPV